MTTKTVFRTPWGWMGIVASARGICAIVLPKPSRRAAERAVRVQDVASNGHLAPAGRLLRDARAQVTAYLTGKRHRLDFPIDLSAGTAFQRRVWQTALKIPYGRARSYRWIASKVGGKRHSRAVGNALGANPVPLVVPCHRVVARDASLGGFSGGLAVKRKLLDLEGTLALLKQGTRR